MINDTQKISIKVMTFNIRLDTTIDGKNQWENRKEAVLQVIQQEQPDILGLQEPLWHQLDYLQNMLPDYTAVGDGREGGNKGEFSPFLFKTSVFEFAKSDTGTFWLSDTPGIPSKHWGNHILRICSWGRLKHISSGEDILVYNTHLDHESALARLQSVRAIVDHISMRTKPKHYILMGDFNANESSPPIQFLQKDASIPLVDSYRVIHPDEEELATFHDYTGFGSLGKIDYIFAGLNTKIINAQVLTKKVGSRYPSDHYPVVMEFEP
ncbi:MAG: endonuclease/exonuclease/phosphatase family protein [Lentisphaeria bacterium]|nr:endonuclease/exonuclease/phosphatase family protein [Lentisphaeria bacterium]